MQALNLATGKVQWDTRVSDLPLGAATVSNDLVFTTLAKGTLIALNRSTGAIVFRQRLPASTNAPIAIAGNTVLVPDSALHDPGAAGGPAQLVAYTARSSVGSAARQVLMQARERIAVRDADDALGAVPGDAELLPAVAAEQLDVAGGGQQVLLDDGHLPAGVRGEDEALAGDRKEAGLAVDLGQDEVADALLVASSTPQSSRIVGTSGGVRTGRASRPANSEGPAFDWRACARRAPDVSGTTTTDPSARSSTTT